MSNTGDRVRRRIGQMEKEANEAAAQAVVIARQGFSDAIHLMVDDFIEKLDVIESQMVDDPEILSNLSAISLDTRLVTEYYADVGSSEPSRLKELRQIIIGHPAYEKLVERMRDSGLQAKVSSVTVDAVADNEFSPKRIQYESLGISVKDFFGVPDEFNEDEATHVYVNINGEPVKKSSADMEKAWNGVDTRHPEIRRTLDDVKTYQPKNPRYAAEFSADDLEVVG
jgi:hypothetical protein